MEPISPKKPPKKEIAPTSIPGKLGWKGARVVSQDKEGKAVPRASLALEEKASFDKPITESAMPLESKEEAAQHDQLLINDVLNLIMEQYGDIPTALSFKEASQELKKLSENIDFKKIENFIKTHHPWGLKDEALYRLLLILQILLFIKPTGSMPSIEEIKKMTTLDTSLSPQKALEVISQLEKNYKMVQPIWNDLLQGTTGWAAIGKDFMCSMWFSTLCPFLMTQLVRFASGQDISGLGILATFGSSAILGKVFQGVDYDVAGMRLLPLPLFALTLSLPAALLAMVTIASAEAVAPHGLAPITQFRTAVIAVINKISQLESLES